MIIYQRGAVFAGRFRLEAQIAKGGVGQVCKWFLPSIIDDVLFREMFLLGGADLRLVATDPSRTRNCIDIGQTRPANLATATSLAHGMLALGLAGSLNSLDPFVNDYANRKQISYATLHQPVPPLVLPAGDELIAKLLGTEPARRCASAARILDDLYRILAPSSADTTALALRCILVSTKPTFIQRAPAPGISRLSARSRRHRRRAGSESGQCLLAANQTALASAGVALASAFVTRGLHARCSPRRDLVR